MRNNTFLLAFKKDIVNYLHNRGLITYFCQTTVKRKLEKPWSSLEAKYCNLHNKASRISKLTAHRLYKYLGMPLVFKDEDCYGPCNWAIQLLIHSGIPGKKQLCITLTFCVPSRGQGRVVFDN